jgi:hypothetical protein
MKAHRRNGIPTLMLQTGGSTGPSSRFGRLFQESDIEKQRQRERAAAQRAGLRSVLAGLPSLFDPLEKGTYDAVMAATKPIQGFQRQGTPFPGQRTQGLTALNAESYSKALGDSFVNLGQFFDELKRQGKFAAALSPGETEAATASRKRAQEVVADLRAKIGGELNRANPIAEPVDEFGGEGSLEADILRQAQASSQAAEVSRQEQEGIAPQPLTQAQRAADALSGGVLRPQTTSAPAAAGAARQEQEGLAGTAATPTGTATTPAGTAATPAATVAPEIPEAEALRQATGAPTQAEEAAATADKNGAPTPTTNPTVVTSIQSTISDIMGGEEAQFDEGKRLQELKEKFGLGISDMEKAAPGLAFAFSLMGAQRAPGESPFNALVRAAGSAGEAATKSNLALKQRERAIDSSLASTVLGEKKAAEQYARSKEWVALWNGGFDERGVPQAEYLRMNADQIQKANDAGLQIVPVNVVSSATTAFATRSKAGVEARTELIKQMEAAGKGTSTSISIGGEDVKATSFQSADGKTFVIPDDVAGVANTLNSTIKDTAETISLIGELRSLAPGVARFRNVGAAGVGRVASLFGMSKEDELSPEQFAQAAYAKANSAWNVESLRGLMSKTDASKVSSEMSREDIGKYFGQDAADAYDDKEKLNSIISKKLPKLTAVSQMPERVENEDKTAYEKRVRFKAIQNALAAQLAPILLGESGRTISDADRVRVIALLGGFADFSKAGVLTTEEEMNQSINELERIIRKYQSSSKQDAETFLTRLDEASTSPSYSGMRGYIYTPDRATSMAVGSLAQNYEKAFPKETPGQSSGGTPVSANELLGDKR